MSFLSPFRHSLTTLLAPGRYDGENKRWTHSRECEGSSCPLLHLGHRLFISWSTAATTISLNILWHSCTIKMSFYLTLHGRFVYNTRPYPLSHTHCLLACKCVVFFFCPRSFCLLSRILVRTCVNLLTYLDWLVHFYTLLYERIIYLTHIKS